ncbi:hypothetical protein UlMin_013486 [Ulmus minor]
MAWVLGHSDRARAQWQSCLASAFRTALACTIVGCFTFYAPPSFQNLVAFPAFSYVTVILIVTDARLGDTFRGCWLALYATVQSLGPAMLGLWLIGPTRFSRSITALAVALGAFVVALPESTHLVSKRIALGQIVIVYVIGFINGDHTDPIMHPLRVAASTAVGVLACVLALLLPIPRLAFEEVKHNCALLAENASERLKHLVEAFCADDTTSARESISQAKSLASAASKLLPLVKRCQEIMQWERPPLKFLKPVCNNPGEKIQDLEVPLRGMEMALMSNPSFPIRVFDEELKDGLLKLQNNLSLEKIIPNNSLTVPEPIELAFVQTLDNIPPTHKDLPSFFFLFCAQTLQAKLSTKTTVVQNKLSTDDHNSFCFKKLLRSTSPRFTLKSQNFMSAFKCFLSLGLSVFFGLIYSKENGFWAGLPVAISFSSGREATFRVTNLKAQGTVLGTIYGVIGCFVFERFVPIRFLSLLPWFIFTSFLQRSKMYGQAGGISAVIGAILILGRKNFGPPSEFAIARIAETFIGLSCSIMVELLLQPTRASTLAKINLSKSLGALYDCVNSLSLQAGKIYLEENRKSLEMNLKELGKFVGEAEAEPNFWFLPFNVGCYHKLSKSLSKMVDLLEFSAYAMRVLQQEKQEAVNRIDCDLELFKKVVCSSIKCVEEVSLVKSLPLLQKELERNKISNDIELGKTQSSHSQRASCLDEDEIGKMVSSYLQHSNEVVEKLNFDEGGEEVKRQMVLSLSAFGFCLSSLIRETREIEAQIKELIQWENPSSRVNLSEISCVIHALQKGI